MTSITLAINGTTHHLTVPDGIPLLWVLRDTIGLTGSKYGCGVGSCGACTVQMDGVALRSCTIPAAAAVGRRITTIEGLKGPVAERLREAWIEEDVAQCGYCQAGQLMTAEALCRGRSAITDAEIDTAMSPHICRCGTYQRIRRAIHRAQAR